jgi:thiopurine S-methyltransferase
MDLVFSEEYWTERWDNQETGWDIGHVSTPLKEYFDQISDKNLKILIPGAGNAYEAEYLHNLGFTNIFVADISIKALESFQNRVPDFPKDQLLNVDFFEMTSSFDLIIEQTFFCALHPSERKRYCAQMANLLKPNSGKLVGLLFQVDLFKDHPPFGGNKTEYLTLFEKSFDIELMETARNSIKPRKGNELFIKLKVK